MTTAHRPTFDPARGKSNDQAAGSIYHSRMMPAHTQLKFRQKGQGGDADADAQVKDLRAELLQAEAEHYAKVGSVRNEPQVKTIEDESPEAKRRRILEENKEIDQDESLSEGSEPEGEDGSSGSESDSDSESESDDDEEALMRELEKIRREREEEKQKKNEEEALKAQEVREKEIAYGNPLLNPKRPGFEVRRRWDDDVIFKNQAKGVDDKPRNEFINDSLRSDFHRKFMDKYIR